MPLEGKWILTATTSYGEYDCCYSQLLVFHTHDSRLLIQRVYTFLSLSITGHSLGGALATLFGFYVAAKPRFSNIDRVYIWTYAAPRVGTEGMNVWFIYFIAIYRPV